MPSRMTRGGLMSSKASRPSSSRLPLKWDVVTLGALGQLLGPGVRPEVATQVSAVRRLSRQGDVHRSGTADATGQPGARSEECGGERRGRWGAKGSKHKAGKHSHSATGPPRCWRPPHHAWFARGERGKRAGVGQT
uniref:Uncharacterized protein n=1 Tax=Alexandrium monilatum TaxID=311494 RepID=A0A7S4VSK5_9DINO